MWCFGGNISVFFSILTSCIWHIQGFFFLSFMCNFKQLMKIIQDRNKVFGSDLRCFRRCPPKIVHFNAKRASPTSRENFTSNCHHKLTMVSKTFMDKPLKALHANSFYSVYMPAVQHIAETGSAPELHSILPNFTANQKIVKNNQ